MIFRQSVQICGVTIVVQSDQPFLVSERFEEFRLAKQCGDWNVYLKETDSLPQMVVDPIHREDEYYVFPDLTRIYTNDWGKEYAIHRMDVRGRSVHIEYLKEYREYMGDLTNIFFHIGWEKMLSMYEWFPFHASCIESPYGGILFSGPSGIGKSTQSELWCRWMDSQLVNGDRPMIGKSKQTGRWTAWGSPYAGSSDCYRNISSEIKTIVLLQQSDRNTIRSVSLSEAFRRIYAQLIVCPWDKDYMERMLQMITEMIHEVPVFELSCTPDRDAVVLLNDTLNGIGR